MTDALVALGLVALILWGFNSTLQNRDAERICEQQGTKRDTVTKVIDGTCFVRIAPYTWLELQAYDTQVRHNPMRVRP